MSEPQVDHSEMVNALPDGWVKAMGVQFIRVTADETIAELVVGPSHLQALGIVHGGVYASLVETVASIGAGVRALAKGQYPVGLENHTSFLHAVRGGRLRATARPLAHGNRTAVWEATITDDAARIVARGTVRFLVLEGGAHLVGEGVGLKKP